MSTDTNTTKFTGGLSLVVRPGAAFVAGLDVTPSNIRVRVCDLTGETIAQTTLATPRREVKDALERIREALTAACAATAEKARKNPRLNSNWPSSFPSSLASMLAPVLPQVTMTVTFWVPRSSRVPRSVPA